MTGRCILITGCSSGIGQDAALTLHMRGWRVLATCRQAEDCSWLRERGLESLPLDLASEASIAGAVQAAFDLTGGRVDAVFNNGAFACPGAVEDLPRAALREIFETNLFGQIDLTNRLIPAMRARGTGRIVMNSSVLGFVAARWRGAYVASKFALEGITDTLRLELAGTGIQVSLIEPGPIRTNFRRNAIPHFERHIDRERSVHRDFYADAMHRRLHAPDTARDRFELPPSAVTARLIHAIEARKPRPRYRVTLPARVASGLRRGLPTRLLDAVLGRW
ncbi:MAG: SDR family NAD(P)-dependent oxidoreductase [Rhodobacteraceae bacterium]|nr:SDR family NAD(P)-dependent oxidoreductase [Paracoccaceae bacterium]